MQNYTDNTNGDVPLTKVIISAGVIINYLEIIGLWGENRLSK